MKTRSASLLEWVQGLLERTYRMGVVVDDVGSFVIGDEGYRRFYSCANEVKTAQAAAGRGAKTLVRETEEGVRVCVYYPDNLIQCLEAHPPRRGLREVNVDAFATLVEELDHLLYIAERVLRDRPVSLFELELHANVSKYLVLARFMAGHRPRMEEGEKTWLRYHLFDKGVFQEEDPRVGARYREAVRWAVRFLEATQRLEPSERIGTLRTFHQAGVTDKLALIERLAA